MSDTQNSKCFTVSFIVHQSFTHIGPALESLFANTHTAHHIYVIINSGTSVQIEALRAAYPSVQLIVNHEPKGFASNHNQVMRLAQTSFVALLNDDIRIHPQSLDVLLEYMEDHPEVAVAGPQLLNPNGTPQVSVYSDPTLLRMVYKISGLGRFTQAGSPLRDWLQHRNRGKWVKLESWTENTSARVVPVVKGTAMLVRRQAYEQVGLMDESTRVYGEEVDWHWRFRKHGWQVAIVPDATITHYGTMQKLSTANTLEDRKGILNYFLKHRSLWQQLIIRTTIVVSHMVFAAWFLLWSPQRAHEHYRTALMGAFWHRESTTGHE
ncbi:MAG: glycosyltransferase family 2 protein [Anaerolineae bacterium]|nr:glycosyltransferase family 2 protein [Anaerolineae bacterium]